MLPSPTQPAFPLGRTLALMTVTAALMLVLELATVPAMFGNPAGATQAVLLMGGIVWATGLLSVIPVFKITRRPHQDGHAAARPFAVVRAFFVGMGLRVAASLIMLALAIKSLNLPAGPVAVALMMMYLPLLFVETRIVAGYVKRLEVKPEGGGPGAGPSTTGTPAPGSAKPQPAADDSAANCVEVLA